MKIHLIIEIEDDGKTRKATVQQVAQVAELNGAGVLAINPADAIEIIRAKGTPHTRPAREPRPELVAKSDDKPWSGSGPKMQPEFINRVRNLPEPFTRRSVSVATWVDVIQVTQRLNRMLKHGWI